MYLSKENIQLYPAIIYQNDVPESFTDVSSNMIEWDLASHILDWSIRRDKIKPLFYSEAGAQLENFASLSIEKKLIGCKYFFIPYSLRIQIIDEQIDLENWEFLLKETKQSRMDCVEQMRIKVGQYIRIGLLTLEQTQTFFKDVFQLIEWFEQANTPEFKQWLTNEIGSSFENDGFAQKSYFSEQLKTDLLNIYNGL